MLRMLASLIGPICVAQDREGIRRGLIAATAALGFDNFNLSFEKREPEEFMSDPDFTTWPTEEMAHYLAAGWARRDPMLEYAASAGPPLLWRTADWRSERFPDYHSYLRSVGVRAGVTAPIAGRPGTYSALTALSYEPRDHRPDTAEAASILGMVTIARASALGITNALHDHSARALALLSDKQREILRWVAAGKSNSEIAVIMGQTRRAIDYHLAEILRKLGVTSRVRAAAIFASSHREPASLE